MKEQKSRKKIAAVLFSILLCAIIAWLICKGIVKFYNSDHLILGGCIFTILTIMLYSLFKTVKNMIPQQNDLNGFSREGNSQLSSQLDNIKIELDKAEKEIKRLQEENSKLQEENSKLQETITQQKNEYKRLETEKNNQYKELNALLDKRLEDMRPLRVLVREAENLCEKYSTLKDNAFTEKQQIMDQLEPFFHLVHYAEDSKNLFECAGHRNRIESDPLGIDKIETCPALLISKNEKCISKGKYVVLLDQDKQ